MRRIVVLLFCLYPMYSSTYKPAVQLDEQPEVRLEKKLETFNKELIELERLILKDEIL